MERLNFRLDLKTVEKCSCVMVGACELVTIPFAYTFYVLTLKHFHCVPWVFYTRELINGLPVSRHGKIVKAMSA